jgi:hypothetical protein
MAQKTAAVFSRERRKFHGEQRAFFRLLRIGIGIAIKVEVKN